MTGSNPLKQFRGMDFYFDVVDWVGGYPYEYASREEVIAMVEPLGFREPEMRCHAAVPRNHWLGGRMTKNAMAITKKNIVRTTRIIPAPASIGTPKTASRPTVDTS